LTVVDSFSGLEHLSLQGPMLFCLFLKPGMVQPGWVMSDQFLAQYGSAQMVPGTLFAFCAYLRWTLEPAPNGLAGAVLALVFKFLPGFLLLVGISPF
jgi:chromate transporter